MKTTRAIRNIAFAAAALAAFGAVSTAGAAIHVYKITFVGTPLFFPKAPPLGNAVKSSGYLIYDTVTPGNSQAVEVFKNKTYQLNGPLLTRIFPVAIGITPIDRNSDGFFETASSLVGFQSGGNTNARAYIGMIPKNGFKLGNVLFTGIARSLKGSGSVTSSAVDLFAIRDAWTLDALSALPGVVGSNNTNDGVAAVAVFLQSKGYVQVP
jgi:hypothetical protein